MPFFSASPYPQRAFYGKYPLQPFPLMIFPHMMNSKLILCAVAAALLSGCQSYQENQSRRSKLAQFVISHPSAAQAIGVPDEAAANISSNAARFALRTGLDDSANGDGRGTQVNAVRNTLWQAAITAQFNRKLARKIGHANLSDTEWRWGKTDYFSRLAADQAVDLYNNALGRSIGSENPRRSIKQLAFLVLDYYREEGLWTVQQANEGGRTIWRIAQTKLDEKAYRQALRNLEPLNPNGMTAEEAARYADSANTLREIKNGISAISKIED
ncbi:hypothetical protein L4G92_08240 [Neisseria sp. ZJ106]|nr:hypothetical protein [Neisseria lisongii]MCF7522032.1 hypothetical protein [Neisseria lisongii]